MERPFEFTGEKGEAEGQNLPSQTRRKFSNTHHRVALQPNLYISSFMSSRALSHERTAGLHDIDFAFAISYTRVGWHTAWNIERRVATLVIDSSA